MQTYLVTTAHLEENLWFRDDSDYIIAIQSAIMADVEVLSFILMSNHVHFVLRGAPDSVRNFVNSFKGRYSQYLFHKYGSKDFLRRNSVHLKELPADDPESLERAMAYVQMNSVAAGICSHPTQYPWGTGSTFFNPTDTIGSSHIGEKSLRYQKRVLHSSFKNIPETWLISRADYILPRSYVKVEWVERRFKTVSRMNYFLQTSSRARKRIDTGENALPSFRDQLILQALPDICQSLFQKKQFSELTDTEKTEVLRQLRYRFSANVNQLARVCGLTYADAALMMDTV